MNNSYDSYEYIAILNNKLAIIIIEARPGIILL